MMQVHVSIIAVQRMTLQLDTTDQHCGTHPQRLRSVRTRHNIADEREARCLYLAVKSHLESAVSTIATGDDEETVVVHG
jgi:hypothetical protein